MKILVVDDSEIMRKMVRAHLEHSGYSDIVEAQNGTEAVQQMKDVGVVLTDFKMPFMNGISLAKEIRSNRNYQDVVIVFITAHGNQEVVNRALQEGVDDYIVKPFTPERLLSKVKRACDLYDKRHSEAG